MATNGYPDAALDYFHDAWAVDLLDLHHNTADGIHIASCGGTWLALVAGFGGLRDSDGEVRFRPRLPAEWERLRFRVQVRGQLIEVDMTPEETTYRLLEGRGLPVSHGRRGAVAGAGRAAEPPGRRRAKTRRSRGARAPRLTSADRGGTTHLASGGHRSHDKSAPRARPAV